MRRIIDPYDSVYLINKQIINQRNVNIQPGAQQGYGFRECCAPLRIKEERVTG